MVLFNYSTKELTAKIVYYGPGLCGKTTNLQYIHGNLPGNVKGKMLSLATKTDRTLFFDFLPIDLGEIRGMKTRVQLYTVPGQVFYNETRKLVLKGADGIVFVADSQEQMISANVESFKNLEENLRGHGLTLADMPHVIQFNKRDLPKLATIEQLNLSLNKYNAPFYESVATTGIGIQDTLKAITKLVLLHLTRKYDPRAGASADAPAARRMPAPAPVQAPPAPAPVAAAAPLPGPGPAETQAIPLTEVQPAIEAPSAAAATIEPEPVQQFEDREIDDLVGEVEEIDQEAPAPEAVAEPAQDFPVEEPALEMPVAEEAVDTIAAELQAPEIGGSPFEIDDSNISLAESVEEPPALAVETPEPAVEEMEAIPLDTAPPSEPETFDEPTSMESDVSDSLDAPSDDSSPDGEPRDEVVLTNVADDNELFDDATLDVASIEPGEEREIVVPVELGSEESKKRFKLSVRLRLDPVE